MAQLSRPGLTAEQKRQVWVRWNAGESLSEIGRALAFATFRATGADGG